MADTRSASERSAQVGTSSLQVMEQLLQEITGKLPPSPVSSDRSGPSIDDLKKLLEISQAINTTLDLDRILEMVMSYAIELVAAERGFIMLVEDGELELRRSHNLAPEHFGTEGDRFSRTIADRVIETGESIYTSDALEDPRFEARQSIADLHLRSIMGVPLKHDDQVIGLIYLDNSSEGRIFLQSDLYILELLAQQAAIALANTRLLVDVRRLQQYADNIITSTPVALLVLDAMGRVQRHNERAGQLLAAFGAGPDGNESWLDLIDKGSRDAWTALFRSVIESGNAHSWSRHTLAVDGEARTFRVLVSPLRSEDRGIEGLVVTLDDVTDAEQMREELAKAAISIQKAEQIGDVAHEMNNFLTVITNQALIFERTAARGDYSKIEAGVPRIVGSCDKLARLVEALLRPDRMEPRPQTFGLSTITESLQVIIHAERRFDGVEFEFDVAAALPEVRFDPVHLEMIFYNLCKNAAEAMHDADSPERRVTFRAWSEAKTVWVTVEDSGPGLPPDRLRTPWEQSDSTKSGGHGRGLHNTAVFVEKNGASIELLPHTSLGGAGFKIGLPVADA